MRVECEEWRVELRKERGVPRSSCLMTLREGEPVRIFTSSTAIAVDELYPQK